MSEHKATVEKYLEGHRRADAAQIEACLTEDCRLGAARRPDAGGQGGVRRRVGARRPAPVLEVDRMVAEGGVVAVMGHGGALISRLDTYHVWLGERP